MLPTLYCQFTNEYNGHLHLLDDLSSLFNNFPYVPLPDVNSELFFKTRAAEQPMDDVLDAFP